VVWTLVLQPESEGPSLITCAAGYVQLASTASFPRRRGAQPSAYLVYLYLSWLVRDLGDSRNAADPGDVEGGDGGGGSGGVGVAVSLNDLAAGTGLSRRAVQDAIARLHKRGLIGITRESITAVPEYRVLRPWRR
jgi:hypothetical protein